LFSLCFSTVILLIRFFIVRDYCLARTSYFSMRWWWGPLCWILIMLVYWNKRPRMDMSPYHSNILYWFRARRVLVSSFSVWIRQNFLILDSFNCGTRQNFLIIDSYNCGTRENFQKCLQIVFCCFSDNRTTLRRKSKNWLARKRVPQLKESKIRKFWRIPTEKDETRTRLRELQWSLLELGENVLDSTFYFYFA
jgi:hypothetical protein